MIGTVYDNLRWLNDGIYDLESYVNELEREEFNQRELALALEVCDELDTLSNRLSKAVQRNLTLNQIEHNKLLDKLSRCLDEIEDKQSECALLSATRVLDELKEETGYYDNQKRCESNA